MYAKAFVIFVVTQTIADSMRKRGIATQIVLVPNGADASVFLPQNESDRGETRMKYKLPLDKVVAVYCGKGTISYYRLDCVLSSIKLLSQKVKDRIHVVFYVYGGSEGLKQMVKELKIGDDLLEIRDPLPRKSLAEVLAACDIGLLPFDDAKYLLCARSAKLYEYLSSGLYVISSGPKGGELDEFFSANPALGSFTPLSAKDFVVSLDHVLKTKENILNEDLRKYRHSFIERHYDRKAIVKKAMKITLKHVEDNVPSILHPKP
jgi:glycosyltransferase involved in cell wall biosynthesis